MEERLFWIGLTMGAYAWGTRYGTVQGKLDTFFKERVLLDQEYAMDPTKGSVGAMLKDSVLTVGENLVIRRFAVFSISDEIE